MDGWGGSVVSLTSKVRDIDIRLHIMTPSKKLYVVSIIYGMAVSMNFTKVGVLF